MFSQLGWVDFAEKDRQQMMDVVHLFREQETRDELGIGTIRDALANHFFPGTSTIQTRARYMLFVPWVYRQLERKRVAAAEIAVRARRAEIKLIYALLKSDDTDGVIGKEAKDALQRLPSSVYWSGLGAWAIRLYPGSQDQYHRYLDIYYTRKAAASQNDEEELLPGGPRSNWDPGLPEAPSGFLEQAELALTLDEARYLREHIHCHHQGSLLARLALADRHYDSVDFVWNHPLAASLPASLREDVWHARNFSETILGSILLYNLMLAEKRKVSELIEHYGSRLDEWAASLSFRWPDLTAWFSDLQAFWSLNALKIANIPHLSRKFVDDWLRLVFAGEPAGLNRSAQARRLVHDREVGLKRGRARLENDRALELWTGRSGDRQLDYRWGNAAWFLADIFDGLRAGEVDHA